MEMVERLILSSEVPNLVLVQKVNKYYYIIIIEQSNTPLYFLTLTSDYMFRSHDHHQVYTYNIGPNGVN
jgi:hypothetical protein